MLKKIGYSLLAIIIIIQFWRIDKTNPEVIIMDDFIEMTNPSPEIASILKTTCYDCHSNESKYPWYSNIAPVSWWLKDHINEGRDELNFSEWGTFKDKRKDHKLEEAVEMLEDGEMPLKEYTWTHSEAKLTKEQRELLINWFKATKEAMKPKKNELHLNNGEKWIVNPEVSVAIQNMVQIVNVDIEDGRTSYYIAMAQKLLMETDKIIASSSTIAKNELDQILLYNSQLVEMAQKLEETEDEDQAMILQKDILKNLNKYGKYFTTEM